MIVEHRTLVSTKSIAKIAGNSSTFSSIVAFCAFKLYK